LTRFGPFFWVVLGHFGSFWSFLTEINITHKKMF